MPMDPLLEYFSCVVCTTVLVQFFPLFPPIYDAPPLLFLCTVISHHLSNNIWGGGVELKIREGEGVEEKIDLRRR